MTKPFDRSHQLSLFPDAWDAIPLNKHDATRTMPNGKVVPVGKAPRDAKWTTVRYVADQVIAKALKSGANIGWRLPSTICVVDIDPRNDGDDGIAALCFDLGIDLDEYPTVITGSGGRHVFMKIPKGTLVRDTLEDETYKGVEFKSKGRQVVAAGSLHPNGKPYLWDEDKPSARDGIPDMPKAMLTLITRPAHNAITGGGQYTPDQVAAMLATMKPEDFQDHAKWLQLMQACHHASNGDARYEFTAWSVSDPAFANDADMIGRRWDSLHADRSGGVTFRSLIRSVHKHGSASAIPRQRGAGDDFGDSDDIKAAMAFDGDEDTDLSDVPFKSKDLKTDPDAWMTNIHDGATNDDGVPPGTPQDWPDASVDALEGVNLDHVSLLYGGKFRIMKRQYDEQNGGREYWDVIARPDFESHFLNRVIERDTSGMSKSASKKISLGEAWIRWPLRRNVKGIIFDPAMSQEDAKAKNVLNLWTGFGIQPSPKGSWDRMQELIHEILSGGDSRIATYLLNWCAFMFQKPAEVAEACVVLKGGMGVGKGLLGNTLVKLVGHHGMAVGSSDGLTGRFNAHLQDLIFLFADEAVSAYDKKAESMLKHLITEPILNIEKKGVDTNRTVNRLHIMMASNENYVVPAGTAERRFMVQHVSNKRQQDKVWFGKLVAELQADGGSGYRRMMFDLLERDLDGFHPRDIPGTAALREQKLFSAPPIPRFFDNAIRSRDLGFEHVGDWHSGPVRVFLSDFRDAFNAYCRGNDMKAGSSGRSNNVLLTQEIKDLLPGVQINMRMTPSAERPDIVVAAHDGKAVAFEIPSLKDCCAQFEHTMRFPEGTMSPPVIDGDAMDFG